MLKQMKRMALWALRLLRLNRIAGRLYYRYLHGFASAEQELPRVLDKCLEIAKSTGVLRGADYCEFGVFKGYALFHAQAEARRLGLSSTRFFGFDSFEGLPSMADGDIVEGGSQPFYEGQYSCSLENVRAELDKRGVDWSKTHLIKGYFVDSLNSPEVAGLGIDKVGVALVDCDIYSSTVDVLDFLESRLVDGAIVIMDDWKSYGERCDAGQPRALREFLENSGRWSCKELLDYGNYGRVFSFHLTQNARHDNAV